MTWKITPSVNKDDQLFNRRLLAYYGLAYSAIWVAIIWASWLYLETQGRDVSAPVLTVLMGVPAGLAGLGFFKYLEAAKIEQCATPPEDESEESDV